MENRPFDRVFGTVVFGFMLLVLPFCAGWWISYLLGAGSEKIIAIGISSGIIVGIVLNLLLLKKTIVRLYLLPTWLMIGLLALYSIGIFGFFMGVPVFNVFAGILAGIYTGRQAKVMDWDAAFYSARLKRAQWVSLSLLLMACVTSAVLALSDSHTPANIQGMLSLNFTLTPSLLMGIIWVGGVLLLAVQFALTKVSAALAYAR